MKIFYTVNTHLDDREVLLTSAVTFLSVAE